MSQCERLCVHPLKPIHGWSSLTQGQNLCSKVFSLGFPRCDSLTISLFKVYIYICEYKWQREKFCVWIAFHILAKSWRFTRHINILKAL